MWYVIDAEEDARITYGVCKDTTKEELADAIKEKRLEELLSSVPSKKGDVFFVEAGTIHAIGKGTPALHNKANDIIAYYNSLYMGVGTEDFLYEGNCKLKEKFQSLNYEYTYQESKGIHSWDFWDEYIQNVLKWMFA